MVSWLPIEGHAQVYQRARDALAGSTVDDAYIYEKPDISTKRVIRVPKGSAILVYGKRGAFLDIEYRTLRGWLPAQYFSMDAPTNAGSGPQPTEPQRFTQPTPAPAPVYRVPVPAAPVSKPVQAQPNAPRIQRASSSGSTLPIRLNPYLSLSYAGKTFDNQLRVGFAGTYATSSTFSVGGVLDLVFLKGTYVDIGPIIRNQWNYNSYFFNPALDVGFLYYTFDHSGDSDSGFGFQTALENDIMIYRNKSFQPSINLKVGMDTMFFMFERVRVPFWFAAGATFRF